jgi:hypothetical protein
MASIKEITAMKLNAIGINGTRLKDFIDLVFLSSYLSLNNMLAAYEFKYQTRNLVLVLKSSNYFTDINFKEPIQLINKEYHWELIKDRLTQMVSKPDIVFEKT